MQKEAVSVLIAERKIDVIEMEMNESYTIEGKKEWLAERGGTKATMEVKAEANLKSEMIVIVIPHLLGIHGVGVAETDMINYNKFSERRRRSIGGKALKKDAPVWFIH